jgi:pimeloyl-ACP methyl ester carboxylesterase/DNA-binding CsgD family transcriptional regulator
MSSKRVDVLHDRPDLVAGAAQLLRSAWAPEKRSENPDPGVVEEMLSLDAGFDFGAAALVPQEAVAIAVLGRRNECLDADPAFVAAFPEPAAVLDIRRLAERARRDGSALGLLEAADGALAPAWLGRGEMATRWVKTASARKALAHPLAVVALVFAPSRSSDLAARAAEAFGLTSLEARLAQAFLFAPTLEIAAAQAGIGPATARDALARIMKKVGAARSSDVVRRLAETMSASHETPEADAKLLSKAFGLTLAEAGVAAELARGATQREAAARLGLQPETVRTYAKSVLAKTRAPRAKDLGRLAAETRSLQGLVAVAEPVFTSGAPVARMRLLPRDGERRLAFLDYGPTNAHPALIFHGFTAGRSLPPALASALQARGLRPLVPQRPGFGLTSPAIDDYLSESAADLEALMVALGAQQVSLFARDGGTAAALAFAAAQPQRIARGVLLNPRAPGHLSANHANGVVLRMTRLILDQPHLIDSLGEFIRRRTRTDFLDAALDQMLGAIPSDQEALKLPAVRAQLIRDIQAQFAHTSAGYAAEHALYARGWRLPRLTNGQLVVAEAAALGTASRDTWRALPDVSFHSLPDAGILAQFTHGEALASLIAGSPRPGESARPRPPARASA